MRELWIERRKWPDLPHYGHAAWELGEDEHGLWVELRKGSAVHRGDEVLFAAKHDGVLCVPRGQGWMAWFWWTSEATLYVDIATPPVRTGDEITMVDLDLDVIRWQDGRVELVDEDELEQHRVELGYPDDLYAFAVEQGQRVLDAARLGDEPFDGAAAAAWFARREPAAQPGDRGARHETGEGFPRTT